ncbi:unnamed protein product [Leptidea sinapis]|uniref:Protein prenyltransferase alpha subunit repeat-containing protein 1 n=1 Tax=Leptidea sinapis TaxID=189913 RepID=A0A5E4R027_9NEOP|nr:unnamed protein product [Leptidea sinapis]
MDGDKTALVEKIIKDLNVALMKTSQLYAFDIVPVDTNFRNKSPVICLENCLGIESWCVKHVYFYSHTKVMDYNCSKGKWKHQKVFTMDAKRLTELLNVALLINPELTSFWNKRRMLLQQSYLNIMSELIFSGLVLSRKPKCNDAFAYRRWLIGILFKEGVADNFLENIINEELRVCELAADKSPNNYHCWSHRSWLFDLLRSEDKHNNHNTLFIKEYCFSEKWTSRHVSDFSCFHYRQFCIKNLAYINDTFWKALESSIDINLRKLLVRQLVTNLPNNMTVEVSEEELLSYSEENLMNLLLSHSAKNCNCNVNSVSSCRKLEVLSYELSLNNELIEFYKCHETLWYHRRFILHEISAVIYDHFGMVRHNGMLMKNSCKYCSLNDKRQKQAKISQYDSNSIYGSILFSVILNHEKKFIKKRVLEGDNYAGRHEKYMKFVEGLNNVM